MDYGIVSVIPPILAIVLAMITKQVILSLFIAIFVGATIIAGFNPALGLMDSFSTYILPNLGDSSNAGVLNLCMFCGGLSLLLERGGGAQAFADKLNKSVAKTRKSGQILTWLGGLAIWFSDSTNPVLVGPVFRQITDKLKISREKLAYIVDTTTAAVPTLFPISAWGAYIISIITAYYHEVGYNGNPMTDFVSGIPFQYYTIGCILMVAIIAVLGWDYGPMKKAENRALREGKLFRDGAHIARRDSNYELPEGAKPSILNMVVPLAALIILMFAFFLYTGNVGENGIFGALANASSIPSLVTAFFITAVIAAGFGIKSKVFTPKTAVDTFLSGIYQMFETIIIMTLAWGIGSICKAMGTSDFIVRVSEGFLTPTTMCLVIFIAACFTSFSTGSSWSVFAIFTPIAVSLAIAIEAPVGMAIGCVLSGGIFGDHCSPISDTTVLSSMGSSCDHIDHVTTQLPYALTVAFSALIGYLILGITGDNSFIGLGTTLLFICVISFLMNKFFGKGKVPD